MDQYIIPFNHILVLADERDLRHFNLNQLPSFRYETINKSEDLARKRIVTNAPDADPKAVFIGIGSFDALDKTPIDVFHDNLIEFFRNNKRVLDKNCHLAFIKPRMKSSYNQIEKLNLARYISTAYGCFLETDPETTYLSMDRKPRIVSIEYKKLFENIFEPAPAQPSRIVVTKNVDVEVEKKAEIEIGQVVVPPAPVAQSNSSSSSSTQEQNTEVEINKNVDINVKKTIEVDVTPSNAGHPDDKKVIIVSKNVDVNVNKSAEVENLQPPQVVQTESSSSGSDSVSDSDPTTRKSSEHFKPADYKPNVYDNVHPDGQPEKKSPHNINKSDAIETLEELPHGRYMLFFKGFDFVNECTVSVKQNGTDIGATEKFSKKEYGMNPYFKDHILADFDHNPLNQQLEIVFGNWGHLNVSMKQILHNESFKIHALKKSVKTARVSIIALRSTTNKTTIQMSGRNFKKMDMIGQTDSYFKVYLNSPQYPQDVCIYHSETVNNDNTPVYNKFELYDGRYNYETDTLIFKYFDKNTFSDAYIGQFSVDYKDLTNFTNYNHPALEILNDKGALNGEIYANIITTGVKPLPNKNRIVAQNYRIYISAKDLEKESNQIQYEINGFKGKTEKISKTKSPAFSNCLLLSNINQFSKFTINLSNTGNKKEKCEVNFQNLIQNGLNNIYSARFGQGILYLQLVLVNEDAIWTLQIDADDIPKMDKNLEGSKCDPYFMLYLDENYYYTSKAQKQTLSASFLYEISAARLNSHTEARFDFYDKDMMSDDVIGTVTMSVDDIIANNCFNRRVHQKEGTKSAPKGLELMRVAVSVVKK